MKQGWFPYDKLTDPTNKINNNKILKKTTKKTLFCVVYVISFNNALKNAQYSLQPLYKPFTNAACLETCSTH